MAPLRDDLAAALAREETEDGARRALDEWARRIEDHPGLVGSLYRASLLTNLAGELFVRDIEVKASRRTLVDERPPTFLHLPFTEAIDHFSAREVMSPDAFAELVDAERFRAFSMARTASQTIRENAFSQLSRAMEPGGPGLREFIRQVRNDEVALGFTPNSPGYLENVYRTATATSYGAGRLRAQTSDAVRASTGFWQYVTVGDDRVRDEHAELSGKQWPIGDPEALDVYPPNGYQCRCVMVTVDREDVDEAALNRTVDIDGATQQGFRGSPDAAIELEALAAE